MALKLCAQTSAEAYYLESIKLLKLQDCEGANNAYEMYKKLSGKENDSINNAILDCLFSELERLSNNYEGEESSQEEKDAFLQEFENSYDSFIAEIENEKKMYIDLGLPSGTNWKDTNEQGYYTYNSAIMRFREKYLLSNNGKN